MSPVSLTFDFGAIAVHCEYCVHCEDGFRRAVEPALVRCPLGAAGAAARARLYLCPGSINLQPGSPKLHVWRPEIISASAFVTLQTHQKEPVWEAEIDTYRNFGAVTRSESVVLAHAYLALQRGLFRLNGTPFHFFSP